MSTTVSLEKVLEVAQDAARQAGKKIRDVVLSSGNVKLTTKSATTDLVTETDEECEKLIIGQIRANFPDAKIIGEESSGSDKYELSDSATWTIDPIDGTTNFVHRLKMSCVIISYIVKKAVKVGVIYDPYADEMFWAISGKGAFLSTENGESVPIHVSTTTTLSNACISMDCGYGRDFEAVQSYTKMQAAILSRSVRNLRVIGCTGLNMAWVSCGRLDGGFELGDWDANRGPKIWDFAAGTLLLSEAGGLTLDIESPSTPDAPLDLMKRSFFCAANPTLAAEILECIAEGRATS
mmetsp:Transcript_32036/g.77845  ORF Transcript_32036/g.77845 Transcript_32036/m.77845 type:complete len:294 (-) Transcript_32036:262-1143(-)|eukprot:CAMPEP_0113628206 /NCGR_PEP_ID=MMETSP0017_2-20120614/14614_1 /TAXON_ID=2856 /ORGANISM="Cylindrotheca closterium" /LENGTH=293 /DNA_ID=CAMNT_0000538501 /DNA_START=60 /DNA_END=941 /DNA_ORIENTATION=+ /assembly_acc=CAM_ASM_000147